MPNPPTETAAQAAQQLWRHRQAGTVLQDLPAELRPLTRDQGYAIQEQLPVAAGQVVVGWKVAATSLAGQRHINVNGPLAGRILSSFVIDANTEYSLTNNRMRVAEPEFLFRMARDLAPRSSPYTVKEVLDAVATLHPAFEIPDSRFVPFTRAGEAQLIADNACCGSFLLGAAAPVSWRALDLPAHPVQGTVADARGLLRLTREGSGRNVLGDPRQALLWLVNELSGLSVTLAAGQFVSTGTCMVPLEIAPGDTARADFGVLGSVVLRFRD